MTISEMLETVSYAGKIRDWRDLPKLGEEGEDVSAFKVGGGPGSGNFGHAGRPGQEGGSADSNWSASKGGVLYHGTSASPKKTAVWGNIEDRPMFLTTNHDEAKAYADQVHRLGASASPDAHIIEFDVKRGKQLDVDKVVIDALENGDDPEMAAITAARKAGADFAVYHHPSGVTGKITEQRVVIVLNPRKSLSYKRAKTTEGRFLKLEEHENG